MNFHVSFHKVFIGEKTRSYGCSSEQMYVHTCMHLRTCMYCMSFLTARQTGGVPLTMMEKVEINGSQRDPHCSYSELQKLGER